MSYTLGDLKGFSAEGLGYTSMRLEAISPSLRSESLWRLLSSGAAFVNETGGRLDEPSHFRAHLPLRPPWNLCSIGAF
jgi:hypothetical protein